MIEPASFTDLYKANVCLHRAVIMSLHFCKRISIPSKMLLKEQRSIVNTFIEMRPFTLDISRPTCYWPKFEYTIV